jgi:hypothetical protein
MNGSAAIEEIDPRPQPAHFALILHLFAAGGLSGPGQANLAAG